MTSRTCTTASQAQNSPLETYRETSPMMKKLNRCQSITFVKVMVKNEHLQLFGLTLGCWVVVVVVVVLFIHNQRLLK